MRDLRRSVDWPKVSPKFRKRSTARRRRIPHVRNKVLSISILGLIAFAAACAREEDPGDLDFDLSAQGLGTPSQSTNALFCSVLKVANTSDAAFLTNTVGMSASAANTIIAHRRGADGVLGSDDDSWYRSVDQLYPIVHIDQLRLIKSYVQTHAGYDCATVSVQLLGFNDLHGNLRPPAGSSGRIVVGPAPTNTVDAGGTAFFATHLAQLRATNPNTVVVTAGDLIGASPLLSALFHDEPTIESMNLAGLEIASVGNHEFDEGYVELQRMQNGGCHPVDGCQDGDGFEGANFEFLAANVAFESTGETLFPGYTIRSFGNTRVAFVGMTLEGTPDIVTPTGIAGLAFLDEADTVNALVPSLVERGVDNIVILIHEGGLPTGLYDECPGISGPIVDIVSRLDPLIKVVVSGHTHAAYNCVIDGRRVTSAASFGRLITDIDVSIDELTGALTVDSAHNVIVTRTVPQDAAQVALIAHYDPFVRPLAGRVVGTITENITLAQNAAGESTLGDLIADSQFEATAPAGLGGAEVAFMNPGGIRQDLSFTTSANGEAPGEITYEEIFTVQPFGNSLVTMTVSGAQIETLLEQQWFTNPDGSVRQRVLQVSIGFSYSWNPAGPVGDRVDPSTISLNGVPVEPLANYRITVNNFLAAGGDGFVVLVEGTDLLGGAVDLDALEAYFRARPPISPSPRGRINTL